jgi:thioredoxin-like negative regulator of GroEL
VLTLLLSTALAADPAVHVTWRGSAAELLVRPPEGEHVADDAPFDLDLRVGERALVLGGFGEDLARGVRLGDVRGRVIDGDLSVSLCEDGGTRCRLVEVHLHGKADDGRRGMAVLDVTPPRGVPEAFPARIDAELVFEEAKQLAKDVGKPILVDFGAIWCPPCQLMDAELFAADPRPSVVDAFVLAKVDVDDPSSFGLKDRFHVGGYPTLVAVEVDGDELGRLVGYDTLDDTVAWMDAVATGRYLRRVSDPKPAQAAERAWLAVREGRLDEAGELLPVAAAEPEAVAFRLARLHVAPTVEDATWLAERAPGHAIDWVGAVGPVGDTPEGRAAVRHAVEHDLATATPTQAADLLWYAGEVADSPGEARVLYGAGAALVRSLLTGEPKKDKGRYAQLAELAERAGQVDEAIRVLEGARKAFPDEPTFHLDLSRLLLRAGMAQEALAAADRGLEVAWGDNRLTVGIARTKALLALGRKADAKAFVDELLARTPAPAGGADVRSSRYRDQLRQLVDEPPGDHGR